MDLLEHVENPNAVVQEASRLLKPGGLFFFHTFNRTFLSWLIVIKGVEWCVKNAPPDMHILRLFIKPEELKKICEDHGMATEEFRGLNVKVSSKAFWQMVFKRTVPEDLEFEFTNSLKIGIFRICSKARTKKLTQRLFDPELSFFPSFHHVKQEIILIFLVFYRLLVRR